MIVRPPFKVFVVVGVVYCMIELFVDLWQAVKSIQLVDLETHAERLSVVGLSSTNRESLLLVNMFEQLTLDYPRD